MPSANSRMHHKARHRGLSLMIVGEHETAQLRPEMAIKALRQRRRYDLAVARTVPELPRPLKAGMRGLCDRRVSISPRNM